MCRMSLTVVVSTRWNGEVIRPAIWSGDKPVNCQMTAITGMRISGKMSVGVRNAANGPAIRIRIASTTKVYGFPNAIRTSACIAVIRAADRTATRATAWTRPLDRLPVHGNVSEPGWRLDTKHDGRTSACARAHHGVSAAALLNAE